MPPNPTQPLGTSHNPAAILPFVFFRGQTVGKYKILAPLGSGGFGTVYLAEDTWLDKKVALKVPHRQQNLDLGELLHEPRLLGSLNHPNIVTVLTAEKQEGLFFIVMEYIAGETLENVIIREGALELTRALDLTVQIANAVDHAHTNNVIHRDLRPGNVLINEQGLVKVADFGTSRVLEIAAHGTTVIGSPPYMAPEQFHGKAVFASDIYSLGVTMYQLLTGELPYDAPAPGEIDRLFRTDLITPPRLRNPAISKRINDIVLKAMAPDLASRYSKATELIADLLDSRGAIRRPGPELRQVAGVGAGNGLRSGDHDMAGIERRLRARDTPAPAICWKCRKALAARATRCPFCNENQ